MSRLVQAAAPWKEPPTADDTSWFLSSYCDVSTESATCVVVRLHPTGSYPYRHVPSLAPSVHLRQPVEGRAVLFRGRRCRLGQAVAGGVMRVAERSEDARQLRTARRLVRRFSSS
jgi:hypothetical protein